MIDDVTNIQNGLLIAHNMADSKSSGQPHLLPFDLNASPILMASPQSDT